MQLREVPRKIAQYDHPDPCVRIVFKPNGGSGAIVIEYQVGYDAMGQEIWSAEGAIYKPHRDDQQTHTQRSIWYLVHDIERLERLRTSDREEIEAARVVLTAAIDDLEVAALPDSLSALARLIVDKLQAAEEAANEAEEGTAPDSRG